MANAYIQTPVYAWETPYISGLGLVYGTTTTFVVGSGSCTDSTVSNIITLDSAVTVTSTTSGVGGLDTGTIAASTLYHVYAIGNSYSYDAQPGSEDSLSTGGVGTFVNPFPGTAVFSLAAPATGPLLPSSYDMYRYIGSVVTDGSSHFLSFLQVGAGSSRKMWYDVAISVLSSGSSSTYANVALTNTVPSSGIDVLLLTTFTPTGAGSAINIVPFSSTATVGYAVLTGSVASVAVTEVLTCPCTSNADAPTVKYKVEGSAAAIGVTGYIDQL